MTSPQLAVVRMIRCMSDAGSPRMPWTCRDVPAARVIGSTLNDVESLRIVNVIFVGEISVSEADRVLFSTTSADRPGQGSRQQEGVRGYTRLHGVFKGQSWSIRGPGTALPIIRCRGASDVD
jgi:hypothetical protein